MIRKLIEDEKAGVSVEYGFIIGLSSLSAFYGFLAKKIENVLNEIINKMFFIHAGPP